MKTRFILFRRAGVFYSQDTENGKQVSLRTEDVVFMYPPYGREIALWMEKSFLSAKNGATVVCLVPARTDTVWWHSYAIHGEIRFLKGRLKFGDATSSAPFPSAVIIFRPSGVMAKNHSLPQ